MLLALPALCFLLVSVGAHAKECLRNLEGLFLDFNRQLNPNLKSDYWDQELSDLACEEAEDPGSYGGGSLRYEGESMSKRSSPRTKVLRALIAGSFYSKIEVGKLPPRTRFGCNAFDNGTKTRAVCLYEKP